MTPQTHPPRDHWRRFRRLMAVMTVAAFLTAGVAIWALSRDGSPIRLHVVIAMGGGIVLTLLLAGALMGLAFASSRSGHDDEIGAGEE